MPLTITVSDINQFNLWMIVPIGYTIWLLISESLEVYGAAKGGLNFLKSWLNYLRDVQTVRHNKTIKREGASKVYLVNI